MLTDAAQVARLCAERFSVEQTPRRDLILLAQTYLAAGDDAQARAAVARRVALDAKAPVDVRAMTFADVVTAYLQASPARLSAARETLAQLSQLTGADAAVAKVIAYRALGRYAVRVNDDSSAASASEAIIAASRQLTPHDREEFGATLLGAYGTLASLAGERTADSTEPLAVIARAQRELADVESVQEPLSMQQAVYAMFGTPGQPITGSYWYGAAGDTLRPTRGKISIVSFNPARINVPAYRRIASHFADTVELTFVQHTNGYFRDQGPLTPDAEAEILRAYYMDELQLPGALAITTLQGKAIADGRIVKGKTKNAVAYGAKGRTGTILIDADGTIRRFFAGWTPWSEREIIEAIRRLIQR
jgi:hypothetical protein